MPFSILICESPKHEESAVHLTKQTNPKYQKNIFKKDFLNIFNEDKSYTVRVLATKRTRGSAKKYMMAYLKENPTVFWQYKTHKFEPYFEKQDRTRKEKRDTVEKKKKINGYYCEPFKPEELVQLVRESIDTGGYASCIASHLYEHEVPVFNKKTRQRALRVLFKHCIDVQLQLGNQIMAQMNELSFHRKHNDYYIELQNMNFKILDWNSQFFDNPHTVDNIMQSLAKMYKTSSTRHTTRVAIFEKPTVAPIKVESKNETNIEPLIMVV